ncbi:MAG: Hpt domain-containing protein [Deltaproteobacteria bacterium]|nr:Hpt domain-containing protein [Deltaproteobacteria bacterium]
MDNSEKQIVEKIRKIVADIESADFTDMRAWKNACSDLDQVRAEIPSAMPGLQNVVGLCVEGLMFLSENSAKGVLSLVEAISEGLIASEESLSGNSNGDAFLKKAGSMLEDALGELPGRGDAADTSETAEEEEGKLNRPHGGSINDAAALLVQIEPDDIAEMDRLMTLLQALSNNESYSESARETLCEAGERAQALTRGDVSDVDSVIAEIGRLVEDAMDAIEGNEEVLPETAPDPDPDTKRETAGSEEAALHESLSEATPESGDQTSGGNLELQALPEDADRDLLVEFIAESGDLIEAAEEALLALETDPEDMEAVGTVFRAFHTVKGSLPFWSS